MITAMPPAPVVTQHVKSPAEHRVKVVVVKRGDTLSEIAKDYYGKADRWPALYWANKDKIKDPSIIRTGQRLHVTKFQPLSNWQHAKALSRAAYVPKHATYVAPASTVPAAPAAPVTQAAPPSDGSFQQCVIARESGGNPNVMNSTGHYGLYQFSASTWAAYGGNPADFGNASAAEQNQVFSNAMAQGGESNWAPYDGC